MTNIHLTQPTKEELNKLANEVYPGLTMFVRDVNLNPAFVSKYQPNHIIMERGFSDASNRVMGMATTHRFAILSNHMTDFRPFEHGTNWGLFVGQLGSHFKVLDVYEFQGKTQILLLHLPNDIRWKVFETYQFDIDKQLIADSRKRFESKCFMPPLPELTTEAWLERCATPLGMDHNGTLFDTDFILEHHLTKLETLSFRNCYQRYFYIRCSQKIMDSIRPHFPTIPQDDGFLGYSYIDKNGELTFRILCAARIENNQLIINPNTNVPKMKIKKTLLKDCLALDSKKFIDSSFDPFPTIISQIHQKHSGSPTRNMSQLDHLRHPIYPDYLNCLVINDNKVVNELLVELTSIQPHIQGIVKGIKHKDTNIQPYDVLNLQIIERHHQLVLIFQSHTNTILN